MPARYRGEEEHKMTEVPFQIDGRHVDKNGTPIFGFSVLRDENGKHYEPMGTGSYLPGDGYHMTVWALDDPGSGIGGTDITFIDTRDVEVVSAISSLISSFWKGLKAFWSARNHR